MVVDDEDELAVLLARDFEDRGIKVLKANSVKEALEKASSNKVDAVLSDIRMPEEDGTSLLKSLEEASQPTPFFMYMTGHSDYTAEHLLAMGASRVFMKPVDTDVIWEYLQMNLD